MSEDLIDWLRAQIDDDERIARGAVGGWITKGPAEDDRSPVGSHMARHDPARVLREVDSLRKILDEHAETSNRDCRLCGDREGDYPCTTVKLLAAIFDDRPGYREEWRP